MEHGKVTVRWQGRHITVPIESLRRAMVYMTMFLDTCSDRFQHDSLLNSWKCVVNFTNALRRKSVTIGWMQTGAGWQLTADAINHSLVLHALLDVAQNLLKISNCLAGVCAQGVSRLAALSEGATGSVLVFWSQDNESDYKYLIIEGVQSVNIGGLII